ncbi:MAG: tripartite-type tricarboxylate transporter receptor subunit TctC [Parasphingorhabdus sp.]
MTGQLYYVKLISHLPDIVEDSMFKKLIIGSALGLGLAAIGTGVVQAEWAPSGPIKLMIAFKAGGGVDTQARMIAEAIEASKGWKIIPEQVTGKGGANLAKALKDQPGDGTAIGMAVTESFAYNMKAAKNAGYTAEDFTFLTTTAGFQMGIVAKTEKGWGTFSDVVAAAKGGQSIRFGAMSPKLADLAYLLGKQHGVEFNTVMVKGGKGVMNGLNAGDLDVGWGAGIQGKAVKAGDMVNLASGLSTKLKLSPDAPTLAELGVDFNADGYFVFAAPAGLSDEARSALSSAIVDAISDSSSKANGFINKAFGGVVAIQGEELTNIIMQDGKNAEALLAVSAE